MAANNLGHRNPTQEMPGIGGFLRVLTRSGRQGGKGIGRPKRSPVPPVTIPHPAHSAKPH